jgi:hypothetical protein
MNSNISQIQQIITMYRNDNEGKPPASLEELKRYAKFPAEMWIDPLTKQPLIYDPATGSISAPPRPAELSPETPATRRAIRRSCPEAGQHRHSKHAAADSTG